MLHFSLNYSLRTIYNSSLNKYKILLFLSNMKPVWGLFVESCNRASGKGLKQCFLFRTDWEFDITCLCFLWHYIRNQACSYLFIRLFK